jgi:hypothetical protein
MTQRGGAATKVEQTIQTADYADGADSLTISAFIRVIRATCG